MSVYGWAADSSGCCWYRIALPLGELGRRGHETSWSTKMPNAVRFDGAADVVLGQRVCQPGPTSTWQRLCREGHSRMVFELDDDLLAVDPSNIPAYQFFGRPEIRANLVTNLQMADEVTVSTDALAEVISEHNPNVTVIPNYVPGALLDTAPPPQRTGDPTVVGWAGSSSHAMDFEDAGPELIRFLRRNPGVQYHSMGGSFAWAQKIPAEQLRVSPWFDSVDALYRAIDFDTGLAPLRPHIFNRSKSAIKALEYAALGIPVVASDVGPYSGFVRHGETGFLVRYAHEWGQHLRKLVADPDLRTTLGTTARQLAARHTIERNIGKWEQVLCDGDGAARGDRADPGAGPLEEAS